MSVQMDLLQTPAGQYTEEQLSFAALLDGFPFKCTRCQKLWVLAVSGDLQTAILGQLRLNKSIIYLDCTTCVSGKKTIYID